MVKNHILEEVYFDNLQTIQAGEIEDGITHDVAADIGYLSAERTQELIKTAKPLADLVCSTTVETSDATRAVIDEAKAKVAGAASHVPRATHRDTALFIANRNGWLKS